MSFAGYRAPELESRLVAMRDARVQNCEMESGILLTLAALFGLDAGCICVVSDRAPWPGPAELDIDKNMDACIAVATDAMLALAKG
jgi:uridine phosphorylase